MHVSSLKKFFVSVVMLEDRGYDVVFSEGKYFMWHKTMGQAKMIGIQVKNLYKMYGFTSMMAKADQVVSRDEGELWHRSLGHIHHGALKVMQYIYIGLTTGSHA